MQKLQTLSWYPSVEDARINIAHWACTVFKRLAN